MFADVTLHLFELQDQGIRCGLNFSNQFDIYFPLFQIMIMNLRQ